MAKRTPRPARRHGFTLIELLISIAIIGILAAVGIPSFLRYQLKSKSVEVKTNLGAIRVAEEAYFSEYGLYVSAAPEPPVIPGADRVAFNATTTNYALMGWSPEGNVLFSYGVNVSPDQSGYTADGGADIDADGLIQYWGLYRPDRTGAAVPAAVGCDVSVLSVQAVGPCHPDAGNSLF